MSIRVSVNKSKIMHMPIKVGIRVYSAYANCQTLVQSNSSHVNHYPLQLKTESLGAIVNYEGNKFRVKYMIHN